ncbi:hypothetical protein GCM10010245_74870 [Streptomyces spectabilis]|nr:hypothetical protein GCM10010245_74870 [Streptomyces spectabilis]
MPAMPINAQLTAAIAESSTSPQGTLRRPPSYPPLTIRPPEVAARRPRARTHGIGDIDDMGDMVDMCGMLAIRTR